MFSMKLNNIIIIYSKHIYILNSNLINHIIVTERNIIFMF